MIEADDADCEVRTSRSRPAGLMVPGPYFGAMHVDGKLQGGGRICSGYHAVAVL
jgi:hypothetical protein